MHIGLTHPWALIICVAAALTYGVFYLNRPPSVFAAFVRAAMMVGLLLAFWEAPGPLRLAFAAAALGDFFFAFAASPQRRAWSLPLGMLAFFIMLFAYMGAFLGTWLLSGDGAPEWPRYAIMAVAILDALAFVAVFWALPRNEARSLDLLALCAIVSALGIGVLLPFTSVVTLIAAASSEPTGDALSWTLLFGVLAIGAFLCWRRRSLGLLELTSMAFFALNVELMLMAAWLPWAGWPAMLGAYLFLLSTALLLWLLFRPPLKALPPARFAALTWWTYVAAQALLASGAIFAARASFV